MSIDDEDRVRFLSFSFVVRCRLSFQLKSGLVHVSLSADIVMWRNIFTVGSFMSTDR
jgi:hypothetical protein